MRQVFRTLAFLVALGVVVQAAVMVYAVAGQFRYIEDGGVLDRAATEQWTAGETLFPEQVGFMLHAMNGGMVIPALAVLLLIASFFSGIRGAWKWALAVLGLVALQVMLGYAGYGIPFLGAFHGVNALILFSTALYTGWRVAARGRARAAVETEPPAAPAAERLPS